MLRESEEKFAMSKAEKYYEYKCFSKFIEAAKKSIIEGKAEAIHLREKCQLAYLKAMFEKWAKEVPELRGERLMLEVKEDEKVREFRYRRYGAMLLQCLRTNKEEMAIEKEKNKFKLALRSKVSGWL